MAAATILLRRSVASSVSVGGSQLYCRYAVRHNYDITNYIPTLNCFLRQFSSSVNKKLKSNNNYKFNKFVESPVQQQSPIINEAFVRDLLIKFNSTEKEKEALQTNVRDLSTKFQSMEKELRKYKESEEQKANDQEKEEEVVVVEEKDPLLKAIEFELSNAQESSDPEAKLQLPCGFMIECDEPGESMVKLKKYDTKESITIQVSDPRSSDDDQYEMSLTLEATSSRIFALSKAEFHCTMRPGGSFEIHKINFHSIFTGIEQVFFGQLPRNLQAAFYTYLDTRGVNSHATITLYNYMLDKMKRENMRLLEKYIEKDD